MDLDRDEALTKQISLHYFIIVFSNIYSLY